MLPGNIYVKEDFSKEVLEKRKELIPQLMEARNNGRVAFIKYDKLVIKENTEMIGDKRKRNQSTSPKIATNIKKDQERKMPKINAFERMYRGRSHTMSETNKA